MKESTQMGRNRTGIQMAPQMGKMAQEASDQLDIETVSEADPLGEFRSPYIREAETIGSVPIPGSMKGVLKAAGDMVQGQKSHVFIDKLGERLAFERTGVRLYDAFITKCEATECSLPMDELNHYRTEEAEHFQMLKDCMEQLGADPTAMTPAADASAVASEGVMKVITDPRMSIPQSLEALLIAELADHDGWELLTELAQQAGKTDMVKKFQQALQQEEEHLAGVRRMVKELSLKDESMLS